MERTTSTGRFGKAHEADYIRAQEARALARRREQELRDQRREALARLIGAGDPALVDRLLEAGLEPEAFAAFELLPLVEMAWVDGRVEASERLALLEAATDRGVTLGSPAHAQLETWLRVQPAQPLYEAWRSWIGRNSACGLDERFLVHARNVAKAGGGFLGLARVSRRERKLIEQIRLGFLIRAGLRLGIRVQESRS
jgi:hypothetical protein